jgi:hypothetical protein
VEIDEAATCGRAAVTYIRTILPQQLVIGKLRMIHRIECLACNASFRADASDLPAFCPECGSDKLIVKVAVADTLSVGLKELVKLKGRSGPGKSGIRRELVQGDELTTITGLWARKHRLMDKDEDQYRELVIEEISGKVLRDVSEPLTSHQGRGSARQQHRPKR